MKKIEVSARFRNIEFVMARARAIRPTQAHMMKSAPAGMSVGCKSHEGGFATIIKGSGYVYTPFNYMYTPFHSLQE